MTSGTPKTPKSGGKWVPVETSLSPEQAAEYRMMAKYLSEEIDYSAITEYMALDPNEYAEAASKNLAPATSSEEAVKRAADLREAAKKLVEEKRSKIASGMNIATLEQVAREVGINNPREASKVSGGEPDPMNRKAPLLAEFRKVVQFEGRPAKRKPGVVLAIQRASMRSNMPPPELPCLLGEALRFAVGLPHATYKSLLKNLHALMNASPAQSNSQPSENEYGRVISTEEIKDIDTAPASVRALVPKLDDLFSLPAKKQDGFLRAAHDTLECVDDDCLGWLCTAFSDHWFKGVVENKALEVARRNATKKAKTKSEVCEVNGLGGAFAQSKTRLLLLSRLAVQYSKRSPLFVSESDHDDWLDGFKKWLSSRPEKEMGSLSTKPRTLAKYSDALSVLIACDGMTDLEVVRAIQGAKTEKNDETKWDAKKLSSTHIQAINDAIVAECRAVLAQLQRSPGKKLKKNVGPAKSGRKTS